MLQLLLSQMVVVVVVLMNVVVAVDQWLEHSTVMQKIQFM